MGKQRRAPGRLAPLDMLEAVALHHLPDQRADKLLQPITLNFFAELIVQTLRNGFNGGTTPIRSVDHPLHGVHIRKQRPQRIAPTGDIGKRTNVIRAVAR